MPVFIIDKLKPKNNGVFKLMDTLDINHKGYSLEDFLNNIDTKLEDITNNVSNSRLVQIENRNDHLVWKYADEDDSAWRELYDFSNSSISSNEIYVGNTAPENEDIKMWIDTSEGDDNNVIEIPTKVSELENDMVYISKKDLSKFSLSTNDAKTIIFLNYDGNSIASVSIK